MPDLTWKEINEDSALSKQIRECIDYYRLEDDGHHSDEEAEVTVHCVVCGELVINRIYLAYFNDHVTDAELRHLQTDKHKQNYLLTKLGDE